MTAVWANLASWWSTVPPDFAFLVALPFFVAAVALLSDTFHKHFGAGRPTKRAGTDADS